VSDLRCFQVVMTLLGTTPHHVEMHLWLSVHPSIHPSIRNNWSTDSIETDTLVFISKVKFLYVPFAGDNFNTDSMLRFNLWMTHECGFSKIYYKYVTKNSMKIKTVWSKTKDHGLRKQIGIALELSCLEPHLYVLQTYKHGTLVMWNFYF
jgi:hypothetical protein